MDKIIPGEKIHEIVPYSRTHLMRLERAGEFPKRLKLSAGRVGWLASEVEAWINERAEARNDVK